MKVIRVSGKFANGRFEAKGFRVLNKGSTINNDFNTIVNCLRCRVRNVEPYLTVEPTLVLMQSYGSTHTERVYSNTSWTAKTD